MKTYRTVAVTLIAGKQIQIDRSGQRHNWRNIDATKIPYAIREEIEGEIIDGKLESCPEGIILSNGLNYRW